MFKKTQWLYLLAMPMAILSIIYILDLRSLQSRYEEQYKIASKLKSQVLAAQKINHSFKKTIKNMQISLAPPMHQDDLTRHLMLKFNNDGFLVEDIKIFNSIVHGNLQTTAVHLIIDGESNFFNELCLSLLSDDDLTDIHYLNAYKIDHHRVRMHLNLNISNVVTSKNKNDLNFLEDMQWVGYKIKNNKIIAYLKISPAEVQEVSIGSVLKKPALTVIAIDTKTMLIQLDHQRQLIRLFI